MSTNSVPRPDEPPCTYFRNVRDCMPGTGSANQLQSWSDIKRSSVAISPSTSTSSLSFSFFLPFEGIASVVWFFWRPPPFRSTPAGRINFSGRSSGLGGGGGGGGMYDITRNTATVAAAVAGTKKGCAVWPAFYAESRQTIVVATEHWKLTECPSYS